MKFIFHPLRSECFVPQVTFISQYNEQLNMIYSCFRCQKMQAVNIRVFYSCPSFLKSQLDDIAPCSMETTPQPVNVSRGPACDTWLTTRTATMTANVTAGPSTSSPAVSPSTAGPCQASVALLQLVDQSYASQQTISIIAMALFMVLGLCGNICVLLVYVPKQKKQMPNYIMMVLAGLDLFACSVVHPYIIYKLLTFNSPQEILCRLFEYFIHATMATQTLLLTSVSVSRYLAVCRPLAFPHAFPRLVKMITASFIFGLGGSIPVGEFYGRRSAEMHVCGRVYVSHVCHYSDRYDGSHTQVQYSLTALVCISTSILVMTLMYITVGRKILVRRRRVGQAIIMGSDLSYGGLPARKSNNGRQQNINMVMAVNPAPGSSTTRTPILNNLTDPSTSASKETTEASSTHNSQANNSASDSNLAESPKLCPSITTRNLHQKGIHLPAHRHKQQIAPLKSPPTVRFNVVNGPARASARGLVPGSTHASPKSAWRGCKLLFIVTVTFLLSWTPFWVVRILTPADFQTPLTQFCAHLFYVNNAVNPIIYAFSNPRFRTELRSTWRRILLHNRTTNS